jgi:hypothetical protein
VRALLTVMASVVALSGCTASQQPTATQEPQRRYLCLQTAQKPGGYDEQVFATCMASWGYEKGEALPSPLGHLGREADLACGLLRPHSLGAGQPGTISTLKMSRCVFECLGES